MATGEWWDGENGRDVGGSGQAAFAERMTKADPDRIKDCVLEVHTSRL